MKRRSFLEAAAATPLLAITAPAATSAQAYTGHHPFREVTGNYDGAYDIPVEIAMALYMSSPKRLVHKVSTFCRTPEEHTDLELLIDGTWKHMCRTDECDDVCTGQIENRSLEEWDNHFKWKLRRAYGARIGPERFAVIDSMTDG